MACEQESQTLSSAIAYRNTVQGQLTYAQSMLTQSQQAVAAWQAGISTLTTQLASAQQTVDAAQEAYANCINGG